MSQFDRKTEFKRNDNLESLLKRINSLLEPTQKQVADNYCNPHYPVLFVVGNARSGTTLLMQWLAQTGKFAYPTNMMSRFYDAPYVGALMQLLFTASQYNYNDEILDFNHDINFTSNLGKTKGALAPNEFWYFWRRFIPNTDIRHLNNEELKKVKSKKFAADLATIEAVFEKPLALKGMILELNIPFLSNILENTLFLFIKRHPFYNIQSILEARVKFYGDRQGWYSVKPQEYDWLKELDPIEQVAGQVYFTNCAIEEGVSQIDESSVMTINYENFCVAPEPFFNQILDKLRQQGVTFTWDYVGQEHFRAANQIRLPDSDCEKIIKAYKHFSGVELKI